MKRLITLALFAFASVAALAQEPQQIGQFRTLHNGQSGTLTITFTPDAPPVVPVPSLELFRQRTADYGRIHGEWLKLHKDDSPIDPALNGTYYDGTRIYYQIADDRKEAEPWTSYALTSLYIYRDRYLLPKNGQVAGWYSFPHGLYRHFKETGDEKSKQAVILLSKNAPYAPDSTPAEWTVNRPREAAYVVNNIHFAELLGEPHRSRLDLLYEQLIAYCNRVLAIPSTATSGESIQPFMIGLVCETLLLRHEVKPDPRVVELVPKLCDQLWNAWVPESGGFRYWWPWDDPDIAGGTGPAPDLNLMIVPMYGFAFKVTKDTKYRDRGDQVFADGVKRSYWAGIKQFNQQQRWSYEYLKR